MKKTGKGKSVRRRGLRRLGTALLLAALLWAMPLEAGPWGVAGTESQAQELAQGLGSGSESRAQELAQGLGSGLESQVQGFGSGSESWAQELAQGLGSGLESQAQELAPAPLETLPLYATAAVLLDGDSGRVLYEKNGYEKLSMASTTKIMTCILALENGNLEDEVEISDYAAGMPKVKLYVKRGEKYLLKDLLHSLMLESHNDSAAAIAEHIGKELLSEELRSKSTADFTPEESAKAVKAFAGLMNQKARDLGCRDTWFITPNGLDATETFTLENGEILEKEHSTTAADLATIMSYCIGKSPQADAFLEITGCPSYAFSANGRSFSCVNHNAFLNMMEGVISGKTGFTNKAGYCYVGALRRDGKTLVVALLACGWPNNKTYKWRDARKLLEYGLAHYSYREFSSATYDVESIPALRILNGQTQELGEEALEKVVLAKRSQGLEGLLLREDEEIRVECQAPRFLDAPVEAGEIVGSIQYEVGGTVYRTEYLELARSVPAIDYEWCLEKVLEGFLMGKKPAG